MQLDHDAQGIIVEAKHQGINEVFLLPIAPPLQHRCCQTFRRPSIARNQESASESIQVGATYSSATSLADWSRFLCEVPL